MSATEGKPVEVAAWLESLGLERYADAFRDNDIDAGLLRTLTADDLEKLGVASLGHRKRLLMAIAALDGPEAAQAGGGTAAEPAAGTVTESSRPRPSRDAERRQLTVFFCDLVGSTELSATLDPEDLGEIIRTYQKLSAEVVARWDGHVAKYLGDGVLSYFGWPTAHEDDAERAVRAGLDLVEAVAGVEAAGHPLAARVGIATGLVMVGELIGEGAAREQAVVGETPNLAARLEALAPPGGVVIAPATRHLLGDLFELDDLGSHLLKGFAEPVAIARVLAEGRAGSRFEAVRGRRLGPLVGRDHELGLLLDRWRRVQDGEGQVVLLSGEAGIGKSRLLRALRERLAGEPYTALPHDGSPFHTNSALHPVIGLIERAADLRRDDSAASRLGKLEALLAMGTDDLAMAVPLVAALLGIETSEGYPQLDLDPQRQKQRTLEVLVEQIAGLAARQPVLALFEDAHWFDPTTLELLDLLVERVRSLPALFVITFRPDFTPPWTGHAHATQLALSRLGRREAAKVIAHLTGDQILPTEVLDQVVAKTEGIPLFVEELTKTVLETGQTIIPASLHDSLMARLDRHAEAKEIAQIASCIGREFSPTLLAAVADRPGSDLVPTLDRLATAELIFRRGSPPEATYSFKHALLQDAAYQSLLKSKRQRLHARIAQVLEERFPDVAEQQPEILAHHCTEAGSAAEAVEYWQRSGTRAEDRFAYPEAGNHFRRALQLLGELPASAERDRRELMLWLALGPALMSSSSWSVPEVGDAYERARELARRTGEPVLQFTATWGLCLHVWQSSQPGAGQHLATELITLAETQADTNLLLQAHHAAWMTDGLVGEAASCLKHADQGIALYRAERHHSQTPRYGGHDAGVCAHYHKAAALWQLGYPDRALRSAQDAVALARQLGHPLSLIYALFHAAAVHWMRRESEPAAACASEVLAACRQHDLRHYFGAAEAIVGWTRAMSGEKAGIEEIEQGLADLALGGPIMRKADCLLMLVEACCSSSMLERAATALEQLRDFLDETGLRRSEAEVARLEGQLLLAGPEGRSDRAERCFGEALEIARRRESRSLELRAAISLARLWQSRDERQKAYELLAPIYGWFTEGFDTKDLIEAKALLEELR